MTKLKSNPITAKDLQEFVKQNSDFAFEMRVLTQLRGLGFDCSHSGTYRDPVTDKVRQYDIRAERRQGQSTLALGRWPEFEVVQDLLDDCRVVDEADLCGAPHKSAWAAVRQNSGHRLLRSRRAAPSSDCQEFRGWVS